MSFHLPTAWLSLVVHQTTHQLNKDGGIDIGAICQWDGQNVALMHDPSSGTKFDRAYLTHLEVGDRILVRSKMTITSFLDEHKNAATRLSLLVHKAKAALERTEESSSDKSSSDDESNSDDESSSDKSNDFNPDRSGQDDPEEDVDHRRPSKRPRTSTAMANLQRQSRDTSGLHDSDSDSNRQEDANSDRAHAEYGSLSPWCDIQEIVKCLLAGPRESEWQGLSQELMHRHLMLKKATYKHATLSSMVEVNL